LQHTLDGRGDLVGPQIVDAIKDPCGLDHGYHADEAGVLLGKVPFDDLRPWGIESDRPG
jgi:hypothetical protein